MLEVQIISHLSRKPQLDKHDHGPVASRFLCSAIMFIRFLFVVVLDMHKSNWCIHSGTQNCSSFLKLGKRAKRMNDTIHLPFEYGIIKCDAVLRLKLKKKTKVTLLAWELRVDTLSLIKCLYFAPEAVFNDFN